MADGMNGILKPTTQGLLLIPLVDLQAGVESIKVARLSLDEVIRELDLLMERAARIRGYLDGRYGHGCGDQGHDASVKESNKLANKVRKALGYTYARQDLRF